MSCKLTSTQSCDVFVMGAGIAGIMGAIEAAGAGATVALASSKQIFSGSSFYPGTWGLGLIGPENESDIKNLVQSIKNVGCGMVDESLVHTFVSNINPSIDYLKELGVKLKPATNSNQLEFIPCFDEKHRNWNGILFESAKEVLGEKLVIRGVNCLEHCHVVEIVKGDEEIAGVVVLIRGELQLISCKSLVIASGGMGGLYEYRLNTSDVQGMGQSLALRAGATLVNLEFMQMMQGFIKPAYKTIFNEKVYHYLQCYDEAGHALFEGCDALLQTRSTHGPFTSRLKSREIDLKIYEQFLKHPEGVRSQYREAIKEDTAEFSKTYFNWLAAEKGISVDDEFYLGIFYHASNGGIAIDEYASTGVPGLFAAGEATGGMHGADRLGGLSTANGLVFGRIAGRSAAAHAKNSLKPHLDWVEIDVMQYENARAHIETICKLMFRHAMVSKSEGSLNDALHQISALEQRLTPSAQINHDELFDSYVLQSHLRLAKKSLQVMLKRCESRGSHYRSDFPVQDERFDNMIYIKGDSDASC